ncbi:MAG TPA: hypothetical protein VFG01_05390, partial [Acidobacteriota bacterium]|nr:hypothetical protein [Acidobacteriota bacterium]
GTEFGMFVSFDDGKHWQDLKLNLPITPVTDLKIHNQDLVLSTQGRAFWILDELAVLEQIEKSMLNKDAVLFKPGSAYRTQVRGTLSRLSVYYYLKENSESIKIEILDQDDHLIQAFDKRKSEKGLNQFTWDLTHKEPEKIKEAVISLSYTGGPEAVPGTYKVRMTCGEEIGMQSFQILKDPRWDNISVQDLQEQFDLQVKVGQKFTLSHELIKKVRDIREQVQSLSSRALKAGFSDEVKKSAEELEKKLSALEQDLIQTKNESGQDPINYQVKLDNQLAYLYSAIHSQDSKPTQAIYQRYEDLNKQVLAAEKRFKDLAENEITKFEKMLEENNIPRIIIK